jgi:hypothetical protein
MLAILQKKIFYRAQDKVFIGIGKKIGIGLEQKVNFYMKLLMFLKQVHRHNRGEGDSEKILF